MSKNELKTLLPQQRYTLQGGEVIEIAPVTFGKLRHFIEAVGKISNKLFQSGKAIQDADAQDMMSYAFEETVQLMGLVIGKDREWFDSISIADGLAILSIIIEQNFNNETVKKNLQELINKAKEVFTTVSVSLSKEGTASVKSKVTQ